MWYTKKRYWVLLGVVIYIVAKVYVTYTPDTSDDKIPDRIKDLFMQVAFTDTNQALETPSQ